MKWTMFVLAMLASSAASAICNTSDQKVIFPLGDWYCVATCNASGVILGGSCTNTATGAAWSVQSGNLYDRQSAGLLTPIRQGTINTSGGPITVRAIQAGSQNSAGSGWAILNGPAFACGTREVGINYSPN